MRDDWIVLRKIEKQIDNLSWREASIKIITDDKTYELNKTKDNKVQGFLGPNERAARIKK